MLLAEVQCVLEPASGRVGVDKEDDKNWVVSHGNQAYGADEGGRWPFGGVGVKIGCFRVGVFR